MNVPGDAPAERHLHSVHLDEERPAERTSPREADGIAGVDSEVIQPSLYAESGADVDDAGFFSRSEFVERHDVE